MREQTREHPGKLGVVLLQARVNNIEFKGQGGKDHHQGNKDDQADKQDAQQRRQPVTIAHPNTQCVFDRVENHRQDRGPQDRREVGRQHIKKRPGDNQEYENEKPFGQSVKSH